ncbi:N-acetyltransferase [Flavipsychrobacter stenotrophus]|uniref:N-acetyltransferase n=1 Tax=Flavipsychrobacter stenotrophus TaxID=2077091 RepID=A0A2S7SYA6_9BACT|nr:GNAT family protein [Flavipsychrobacter stenotrophus]PQJ11704.1 N-acetyltransferase [Flavipsychrobacter stenotrophus]
MPFQALRSGNITLHLITEANADEVLDMFAVFPDADELLKEIKENYLPEYEDEQRTQYGFYTTVGDKLAGLSLLSVDSFNERRGSTGADTLLHMRGKGIAPMSKPHLFYLGFELLGLNRIETGCLVSNISSKRSIEKTAGFQFEGIMRESGLNDKGDLEDQYLFSILRKDWQKIYYSVKVEVIH